MSHNPGISAKLAFTKVWNSREDPEHIVSNLTMVKWDNQLIELKRNNVRNRNAHANEIEDQNDSDECSIDDADVHIVQEDGGESQLLEESWTGEDHNAINISDVDSWCTSLDQVSQTLSVAGGDSTSVDHSLFRISVSSFFSDATGKKNKTKNKPQQENKPYYPRCWIMFFIDHRLSVRAGSDCMDVIP